MCLCVCVPVCLCACVPVCLSSTVLETLRGLVECTRARSCVWASSSARVCCVGRGPQVFLSQAGLSVPAPAQRLATFTRVPIAAGQSVVVTLPPIPPVYRSVIHETGGNASDVYSLAGKRWNEAGNLLLRISLGGHGEATTGGLPFTVAQTASQDVETCAN